MVASSLFVTTGSGVVEGARRGRANTWKGIPYAAAPIGELRFRAPQPPHPWGGTKCAANFGPIAPQQRSGPVSSILSGLPHDVQMSEDCLNVNVWAPAETGPPRPVMVFIHGGAYVEGSGSMPDYEGTNLCLRGDLVVVTFNYRLGALGQMDFSSFSTDDYVFESNLGLRDQVAALEWIRDNIAAFGGDPQNVTIFGESAGGNAITTLMVTPAARGLFSGAISESSHPTSAHNRERKAAQATELLERLGIDPTAKSRAAAALFHLPSSELVRVGGELQDDVAIREPGVLVMSPTMDDDYLPQYPLDAFRDGNSHPVALLIGTNRDEATLFRTLSMPILPTSRSSLQRMLLQSDPDALDRVFAAYPQPHTARTWLDASTDGIFRVPAIEIAAFHSRKNPTWMYRFDWASVMLRAIGLRATHAAELPFVFGNFSVGSGRLFTLLMRISTRKRVHKRIASHWLTFAHRRDPATSRAPWPAYESGRRQTMIFAPHTRVEEDPQSLARIGWTGVTRHH